jgi:hypothetical protein
MATVPMYVEAFPVREAILHPKGEKIELTPEKEEELPLVSEGAKTKEDSPPAPRECLCFSSSRDIGFMREPRYIMYGPR